jgi:CubicO group peptidase (beta-lactamase class C family)
MRQTLLTILAVGLTLVVRAPVAAADYTFVDGSEGFESFIDTLAAGKSPGFAVIVARGSEVLVRRARGMRDISSGDPVAADTRFYIASVAKTMTAAAIMLLEGDGKLSLDTKLEKYFPTARDDLGGVSVLQLLDHTAGIPDYYEAQALPAQITNDWVIDFTLREPLLFEPGTSFAYSNSAYILLSRIIEKVSGMTYADFLHDRILLPLEMRSTVVFDDAEPEVPERAIGYERDEGALVVSDYIGMTTTGAGGIFSTAGDLLLWLAASTDDRLLGREKWQQMQTPPVTAKGKRSYLAMGWSEETFGKKTPDYEGLEVVASIGELYGFRSTIAYFPTLDLRFVLLSNSGTFPFHTLEVARFFVTPKGR